MNNIDVLKNHLRDNQLSLSEAVVVVQRIKDNDAFCPLQLDVLFDQFSDGGFVYGDKNISHIKQALGTLTQKEADDFYRKVMSQPSMRFPTQQRLLRHCNLSDAMLCVIAAQIFTEADSVSAGKLRSNPLCADRFKVALRSEATRKFGGGDFPKWVHSVNRMLDLEYYAS